MGKGNKRASVWLVFVLMVGLTLGMAREAHGAGIESQQSAVGNVAVYVGVERPGLERVACGFYDGIFLMTGVISQGRFIATTPTQEVRYLSNPIGFPEGYAVRSIQCLPSIQTGNLVVVVGGLRAGSSTQLPVVLATDYRPLPPPPR